MADKTMHHVIIGDDTFELIDEAGREETASLKEDLSESVSDLKSALIDVDSELIRYNPVLEKGGMSNGIPFPSNDHARSRDFIPISKNAVTKAMKCNNKNYTLTICYYNENKQYLTNVNGNINTYTDYIATAPDTAYYCKYFVYNAKNLSDSSVVDSALLEALANCITIYDSRVGYMAEKNTIEINNLKTKVFDNKKAILYKNFILENETVESTSEETYINRLSAIHSIKLIGFEKYEKCRLRYLSRGNSVTNYRFIICGYDGTTWRDVFDTTNSFTVTENTNGDTLVTHTIDELTVIMYIDYDNLLLYGANWLIDMPSNPYRYILSPNVYYNKKEENINYELYAKFTSENNLSIIYKYSDTEIVKVELYPYGVNDLFAPHRISKKTADKLLPDFSGFTTWQTYNTDLVSPYAGLIDTAFPQSSERTVGGNHGTDGAGGFPTAERISINIYVDDKRVELNKTYGGKSVKAIVKTNIAASNTINTETGVFSPAMEETISWIFTPGNIEISVLMKALTDISILGYVGLQMVCDAYTGVYFNDGTAEKTISNEIINSATYPEFEGNRAILTGANNNICVLYTNRNIGVGDLSHFLNGISPSYVSSFGKLYQHLVRGIPLDLNEDEIAVYSGGISITKSFESDAAKSAYIIKYNGNNVYCVDFLASGTGFVKMPVDCIGKEITVIEKDNSITLGNIVTGDGLYVESTGYGTATFKMQ